MLVGRHGGRNKELSDHIFTHKHKPEWPEDRLRLYNRKASLSDILLACNPYLLTPPKQHPTWEQSIQNAMSIGYYLVKSLHAQVMFHWKFPLLLSLAVFLSSVPQWSMNQAAGTYSKVFIFIAEHSKIS